LGIPENQKETYNKKTSRQENRGFALFQPKSHRKNPSGRSPGLAWQRRQPSHAKAQWQFSNIAEIIGLTVAVTTRDLHPLPYSLDCGSATKHLKVMKRTCSTQQPHPTTHFKEWSTWYKAPMKKRLEQYATLVVKTNVTGVPETKVGQNLKPAISRLLSSGKFR
jgi:hypothetical protein